MTSFSNIDRAAHEGANGNNPLRPATDAQAIAGNYKKGRCRIHGIAVVIENPRGSLRKWTAEDGTSGANLMKFHYGYFAGVMGADGDELDCFVGPWPENDSVFVVNQFMRGQFDEHKVMLGFPDRRTAEAGYLSNYTPGWQGMDSCISCSVAQLKWWLAYGDKSRPLTQDQLPYEERKDMDKVIWDSANQPVGSNLAQVLYQIRAHDGAEGLVFDRLTMSELLSDAEGVLAFDALVIPFRSIEARMGVLQKVMDRAGNEVKVTAMQVSEPFTQKGTTNVAAIYELSDGQTVSVFFHNPDVTPKKITPDDDLVSWKWMLNKKDVTIAVAPERGRDLNIRTVAARLMLLAEKNSARFIAANGKRAERMQSIDGLKQELSTKEAELESLEKQIEVAEVEAETRATAPAPEAPVAEPASALLSDEEQAALQRRLSELADRTSKMLDSELSLVAAILGVVNPQDKDRNTLLGEIYANHPDDIESAIARWEATRPEPAAQAVAEPAADPVVEPVSKIDITYRAVDEMFTAFYPNTKAGEEAWRVIAEQSEGTGKVLTQHADSVIAQLREKGYTVSEAQDAPADDDAILNELEAKPAADPVIEPVAEVAPQPEPVVEPAAEDFSLTAESEEDARARIAQEEAAAAEAKAAEEAAAKAEREAQLQKEIDSRQEASAENFQLGQSPEDSLSGQASVFDIPEPAAAEIESRINDLLADIKKTAQDGGDVTNKVIDANSEISQSKIDGRISEEEMQRLYGLVNEAKAGAIDPAILRAKGDARLFLLNIIDGTAVMDDADLPNRLKDVHAAHKDDAEMLALFKTAVKAYSTYAVAKASAALTK